MYCKVLKVSEGLVGVLAATQCLSDSLLNTDTKAVRRVCGMEPNPGMLILHHCVGEAGPLHVCGVL